MLSLFYKDGLSKVRDIKICLETNNIPLYVVHVHALKSASTIIGALTLSEAAAALEHAGKQADRAFIHAHNTAFIEDMEALLESIGLFLWEEAKKEQLVPLDSGLLKKNLSDLKTAFGSFNLAAINTGIIALQDFAQRDESGEAIKAIIQYKLIGDFDKAEAAIDALMSKL